MVRDRYCGEERTRGEAILQKGENDSPLPLEKAFLRGLTWARATSINISSIYMFGTEKSSPPLKNDWRKKPKKEPSLSAQQQG